MEGPPNAVSARHQLAAIASLDWALNSHEMEYWVFGGWAVDFWVGQVTRAHGDIDVAAWRDDFYSIKAALELADWQHEPSVDDVVGTRYRWGGAEVEFTFVEKMDGGGVTIPLPGQPVVWTNDPLGEARRRLDGVSCRVIPLTLLRDGKATGREDAVEGAKDLADFTALSQL